MSYISIKTLIIQTNTKRKMKKLILLVFALAIFGATTVNAQEPQKKEVKKECTKKDGKKDAKCCTKDAKDVNAKDAKKQDGKKHECCKDKKSCDKKAVKAEEIKK